MKCITKTLLVLAVPALGLAVETDPVSQSLRKIFLKTLREGSCLLG